MAEKFWLYNRALFHVAERQLASLTENREPRRVLDELYAATLADCLEAGQWNFAMRSIEQTHSDSVVPTFGYEYAFVKPIDWVRTAGISSEPTFRSPLNAYSDEVGYWWADCTPIYVRYVSDDNAYGGDLSLWPQSYAKFVALHLAYDACGRIPGSGEKKRDIERDLKQAKSSALAKDAMNDPVGIMPAGGWVTSRGGTESWRRRTRGY